MIIYYHFPFPYLLFCLLFSGTMIEEVHPAKMLMMVLMSIYGVLKSIVCQIQVLNEIIFK